MSKIKSVDYIVTAKHYGGSARGYIRRMQAQHLRRGVRVNVRDFDGRSRGEPVRARIWQGQWIADCDQCGGAAFVDPDEPVYFCFGCGNRGNGGYLRPVEFPEGREEIERLVLERPVNDSAGLTDLERVGLARPLVAVQKTIEGVDVTWYLTRSWDPGETVEELHAQQDAALAKWRDAQRGESHGVQ